MDKVLKGWYAPRHPIKFVISDSSHMEVRDGITTSLRGRADVRIVMSMKFIDVASFHMKDRDLDDSGHRLRDALRRSLEAGHSEALFEQWREMMATYADLDRLWIVSDRFLRTAGYPGLLRVSAEFEVARLLRNYLDQTLYRDIVSRHEIKNPRAIELLLGLIATESSQLISVNTMCKAIGLRTETVNRYLALLEQAFLISRSSLYTGSVAKSLRRRQKYYMCNQDL